MNGKVVCLTGAVLLCLASEHYYAADYIRDYDEFKEYKGL